MGIDYDGGMIVGANASTVKSGVFVEIDNEELYGTEGNYYEEFYEWYEDVGMCTYSLHCDACSDYQVVGYTVRDVDPLSEEFDQWLSEVKGYAEKFYKLTGVKAELVGMQNIW